MASTLFATIPHLPNDLWDPTNFWRFLGHGAEKLVFCYIVALYAAALGARAKLHKFFSPTLIKLVSMGELAQGGQILRLKLDACLLSHWWSGTYSLRVEAKEQIGKKQPWGPLVSIAEKSHLPDEVELPRGKPVILKKSRTRFVLPRRVVIVQRLQACVLPLRLVVRNMNSGKCYVLSEFELVLTDLPPPANDNSPPMTAHGPPPRPPRRKRRRR